MLLLGVLLIMLNIIYHTLEVCVKRRFATSDVASTHAQKNVDTVTGRRMSYFVILTVIISI